MLPTKRRNTVMALTDLKIQAIKPSDHPQKRADDLTACLFMSPPPTPRHHAWITAIPTNDIRVHLSKSTSFIEILKILFATH